MDRRISLHLNICNHGVTIRGVKAKTCDLADWQTVEANLTALRQPTHGALEDNIILIILLIKLRV